MKRLYASLFVAFFLSACAPAQPVGLPTPEMGKARTVGGEKEQPKPDKLPEFRHRPGAGLTITGN